MSDYGEAIKEALQDVGTPYEIIRPSGNIAGEFLLYKTNAQVTKPFIREFFLETDLQYDTVAKAGDVLQLLDGTERRFLIMNFTPENMEGATFKNNVVMYKCNVSGELVRPSGEVPDPISYRSRTQWEPIKDPCYGLLAPAFYGTDIEDHEIGRLNKDRLDLFVPTYVGAQTNDRYIAVSGEYYQVDEIERRKFDGVDLCHLSEDTRP